ncbi:hypothetical protein BD413DRAFT_610174 [Trametes elegans]|nr:hypothetical protein BD413DRAFT_610174 [Trametes elegans]
MCVGENLAPFCSTYLNAQLSALYENAQQCVGEHPDASSQGNHRFSALARWTAQGLFGQSSVFQVDFAKPELQFICNHYALLKLKITSAQGPLTVKDVYVTYRVAVTPETPELAHPARFGASVRFETFDFENAELILISRNPDGSGDILPEQGLLSQYMKEYLAILSDAKVDSLFALPQSYLEVYSDHVDEEEEDEGALVLQPAFNHALTKEAAVLRVETLRGVSVREINEYLFSLWLVCSLDDVPEKPARTFDWGACYLAHFDAYDDPSDSDKHVRLEFSAPRIEIICAEELVLYFDIKRLQMFSGDEVEAEYEGWKLAFVMYVLREVDESGGVTLTLDLSRGLHNQPYLSQTPAKDHPDAPADAGHLQRIYDFMSIDFVLVLQKQGFGTIFSRHSPTKNPDSGTAVIEIDSPEYAVGLRGQGELDEASSEEARETNMFGFDQVVAISPESINAYFATLSERPASSLKTWSYREIFNATFKRPSLRLLSDNKAVLWVYLQESSFNPIESSQIPSADDEEVAQKPKRTVLNSRLAFLVELNSCTHHELVGATSETFKTTPVVSVHGDKEDRDIVHIYLNFENARYLHKYSTLGTSKDDARGEGSATRDLQSLVVYLRKAYFPALCQEGLNVVASIPVWHDDAEGPRPEYAMTAIGFQVYSDQEVTLEDCVSTSAHPVIVVFGVCGPAELPAPKLPVSTSWVARLRDQRLGFSHGTVAVSKHIFVEHSLLEPLARINAFTTLIPVKSNLLPGMPVSLELKSWAAIETQMGRQVPIHWTAQAEVEDGHLRYLWRHCEEFTYRCESSYDQFGRSENITCTTENWLTIPTAGGQGAPNVSMDGTVQLTMKSVNGSVPHSAQASVTWSIKLAIDIDKSVLKVKALGPMNPTFALEVAAEDGGVSSSLSSASVAISGFSADPQKLLVDAFQADVDVDAVFARAGDGGSGGAVDGGVWQYFYPAAGAYRLGMPAFNNNGDLLLELCRAGPAPAATKPNGGSARNGLRGNGLALAALRGGNTRANANR